MADHVLELVQASPNFRFLAEPSLQLAGDAAAAEFYVDSDPDAAMGKARRFCETLVKLTMHRHEIPADPHSSHFQRINALFEAGVISAELHTTLHDVRKAGNDAVHDYSGDRQKAADVVRACFDLAQWWYETDTGNPVNLTYTPHRPDANQPSLEFMHNVERRLAHLQESLDAGLARTVQPPGPAPAITISPAAPSARRLQAGSTVACGSATYLVHEPVERTHAEDGSWTLYQADGHCLDAEAAPVRLRTILVERSGTSADRMLAGLHAQASYLQTGRNPRLPTLRDRQQRGNLLVTVTSRSVGSTWAERFGGGQPVDPMLVPLVIDAAVEVATVVADLHEHGVAHRALDGASILITASGRRSVLRDLGLAWWPPLRDEGGGYRAPEQRSIARGRPGAATDVFQLAALLQHTCGGIRPGAARGMRLQVLIPGFPAQLDTLLAEALDSDPARRPAATAFAEGLRRGRRLLASGVVGGY